MSDDAVRVEDPEHMNLLGLLLKGFLEVQLQTPKIARKVRKLRGDFGVQAGDMSITLSFSGEGICIKRGFAKKTRARVMGSMSEMIALVTGSGGLFPAIIAVLEGRISIRGNPFALLGLLPVMIGGSRPRALPAPTGAKA